MSGFWKRKNGWVALPASDLERSQGHDEDFHIRPLQNNINRAIAALHQKNHLNGQNFNFVKKLMATTKFIKTDEAEQEAVQADIIFALDSHGYCVGPSGLVLLDASKETNADTPEYAA